MNNTKYVILPMEEYESLKAILNEKKDKTEKEKETEWKAKAYDTIFESYDKMATYKAEAEARNSVLWEENIKLKEEIDKLKQEIKDIKEKHFQELQRI